VNRDEEGKEKEIIQKRNEKKKKRKEKKAIYTHTYHLDLEENHQ